MGMDHSVLTLNWKNVVVMGSAILSGDVNSVHSSKNGDAKNEIESNGS